MTICAIKVCRNYKGRLKTTKEITYHRIPNDPGSRNRWIEIIRKSRGEDAWNPAKTTVICSEHFRAQDLHYIKNQKRRRLKKEAVPCKALFLSSLESDDDDNLLEDTEKISVTNDVDSHTSESNELLLPSFGGKKDNHVSSISMETCGSMSSNIKTIASGSTSYCIPEEATDSKIGEGQMKEDEDFSDLDSIYDSPKKSKMRQDLRRRLRLQKKHTLMIKNLKRKNIRLTKKVASLKQIIYKLIKER